MDPELSALWDRARRLQDRRRLLDLTGPRPRATRDRLTDLLFVQSGPGVYTDLVGERGWSNHAYQRWLTATVNAFLESPRETSVRPTSTGDDPPELGAS